MARPATLPLIASAIALSMAPPSLAAGGPGFGIDAVGFESSYFQFRVAPGAERKGAVRLVNRTSRPTTVIVRAADVTTAASGGLQYGTGPARADGRWLHLVRSHVRLRAGAVTTVRFRLRAPEGAPAGDHFAGIVALNRDDVRAARRQGGRGGVALRFLPRLAIAVQATVPGGSTRELTAGSAAVDVAPSATSATLALRNTGDLLVGATSGDLELVQGDTVLARRYLDLGAFVPRTEIRLRVPFEGTPARGTYRLRGTLRPESAAPVQVDEEIEFGAEAARSYSRETGREARAASGISLVVVAIGGAAALLALTALAARLRSQRRLIAKLSTPDPHGC